MAKAICIIPARLESSRFPNKILTDIQGMPMFERVYHIAQISDVFSRVFIASPNPEILELCEQRELLPSQLHSIILVEALVFLKQLECSAGLGYCGESTGRPTLPAYFLPQDGSGGGGANPIATIAYEEAGKRMSTR